MPFNVPNPIEAFLAKSDKRFSLPSLINAHSRLSLMHISKGSISYEEIVQTLRLSLNGIGKERVDEELETYGAILYEAVLSPVFTSQTGKPSYQLQKEIVGNESNYIAAVMKVLKSHAGGIENHAALEELERDRNEYFGDIYISETADVREDPKSYADTSSPSNAPQIFGDIEQLPFDLQSTTSSNNNNPLNTSPGGTPLPSSNSSSVLTYPENMHTIVPNSILLTDPENQPDPITQFLSQIRRYGMVILIPQHLHDKILACFYVAMMWNTRNMLHRELTDLVLEIKDLGILPEILEITKTKVRGILEVLKQSNVVASTTIGTTVRLGLGAGMTSFSTIRDRHDQYLLRYMVEHRLYVPEQLKPQLIWQFPNDSSYYERLELMEGIVKELYEGYVSMKGPGPVPAPIMHTGIPPAASSSSQPPPQHRNHMSSPYPSTGHVSSNASTSSFSTITTQSSSPYMSNHHSNHPNTHPNNPNNHQYNNNTHPTTGYGTNKQQYTPHQYAPNQTNPYQNTTPPSAPAPVSSTNNYSNHPSSSSMNNYSSNNSYSNHNPYHHSNTNTNTTNTTPNPSSNYYDHNHRNQNTPHNYNTNNYTNTNSNMNSNMNSNSNTGYHYHNQYQQQPQNMNNNNQYHNTNTNNTRTSSRSSSNYPSTYPSTYDTTESPSNQYPGYSQHHQSQSQPQQHQQPQQQQSSSEYYSRRIPPPTSTTGPAAGKYPPATNNHTPPVITYDASNKPYNRYTNPSSSYHNTHPSYYPPSSNTNTNNTSPNSSVSSASHHMHTAGYPMNMSHTNTGNIGGNSSKGGSNGGGNGSNGGGGGGYYTGSNSRRENTHHTGTGTTAALDPEEEDEWQQSIYQDIAANTVNPNYPSSQQYSHYTSTNHNKNNNHNNNNHNNHNTYYTPSSTANTTTTSNTNTNSNTYSSNPQYTELDSLVSKFSDTFSFTNNKHATNTSMAQSMSQGVSYESYDGGYVQSSQSHQGEGQGDDLGGIGGSGEGSESTRSGRNTWSSSFYSTHASANTMSFDDPTSFSFQSSSLPSLPPSTSSAIDALLSVSSQASHDERGED